MLKQPLQPQAYAGGLSSPGRAEEQLCTELSYGARGSDSTAEQNRVQTQTLPLPSDRALGKSLHLQGPQLPPLLNGGDDSHMPHAWAIQHGHGRHTTEAQ